MTAKVLVTPRSLTRGGDPALQLLSDAGYEVLYLINTARVSLIDNAAVRAGLENGKIAGIALDVFEREPPTESILIKDPRVIVTPHIGGYTSESVSRAAVQAVQNILETLNE